MTEPDSESIARYLAGLASPEESARILSWLDENPSARLHLENQSLTRPDFSAALDDLRSRRAQLDGAETTAPGKRTDREPIGRPIRRPEHTVATPRRVRWLAPLKVAAMVAVVSVFGALLWTHNQQLADEPTTVSYETQPGERLRLRLSDGSSVQLNVDSRLIVSTDFGENDRLVQLEGQAFFDVAPDSALPFLIETATAQVRVVGTEFDVRAYDDQSEVELLVSEGRVEFSHLDKPDLSAVLSRGDRARLDRVPGNNAEIVVTQPDPSEWPAWQRGKLVFTGATLTEVARTLSRWYNLDVEVTDSTIGQRRLDASFDNESLDAVLRAIERSLGLEATTNGNRIEIRSAG